jgi:hypothetical protein
MPSGTASTIIASQPAFVDQNGTMFVDQNGTIVAAAAAPRPTVQATAAPQMVGTFQQTQVSSSSRGGWATALFLVCMH